MHFYKNKTIYLRNFMQMNRFYEHFDHYIKYYGPYFEQVITILRNRNRISRNNCCKSLQNSVSTMNNFPKAFLQEYCVIETPKDNSCLWHTFSITLYGNTHYTLVLRLLTINFLLKNKQTFFNIFENEYENTGQGVNSESQKRIYIKETYEKTVLEARDTVKWGNQFHI